MVCWICWICIQCWILLQFKQKLGHHVYYIIYQFSCMCVVYLHNLNVLYIYLVFMFWLDQLYCCFSLILFLWNPLFFHSPKFGKFGCRRRLNNRFNVYTMAPINTIWSSNNRESESSYRCPIYLNCSYGVTATVKLRFNSFSIKSWLMQLHHTVARINWFLN